MTGRMKVKFITVIWGERYVEEFARVSLPSYLANGNLPHLAEETDLEILIMTSETSRPAFDREPTIRALTSLCPVKYIYIDDLITTGLYGVTLTLAYVRGIADSGPDQIDTYFVFMNADFILADGAMRSLVERFRRGDRCVMAPSLRARSETVLPPLAMNIDRDRHTLTMRPRDMVRLALDNLHSTVIAKTITQEFITCTTHNQIYWQVNETTLLGHYHLIFMLAIKPEVPMGPVNSYCDYGFVPELVPSGKFSVMNDSDEFFMLELQPTDQERHLIYCGAPPISKLAAELSCWTTQEHRRFAERDVVFHAGDLPNDIDDHRAVAKKYIEKLHAKLRRRPIDHVDHYYWVLGVQAWWTYYLQQHDEGEELAPPPEIRARRKEGFASTRVGQAIASARSVATQPYLSLMEAVRQRTGRMPDVAIWHHLWLDSRLVLRWAQSAAKRTEERSLVVHWDDSPLPGPIGKILPVDTMLIDDLQATADGIGPIYKNILIHVDRARVRRTATVLDAATTLLKPGGTVTIYIEHRNSELDPGNLSGELALYVDDIFHSGWMQYRISASFTGGRVKRSLRRIELIFLRRLFPGRLRDILTCAVALIGWPIVAALTAANNYRLRNPSAACPPYCSSALVSLTKPGQNLLSAPADKLVETPFHLGTPRDHAKGHG